MPPSSPLSLFALGVLVILITPGPTNTLLAAAGLHRGVRRAAPLMGAELGGYLIAISVWGYVIGHAVNFVGWLPSFMRVACGAYIAFLAVRMWRAAVALPSSAQQAVGMRTLFISTLLNPKAMLFAGTLFPSAAFVDPGAWLHAMSLFVAILVPVGFLWISFGAALGTGRLAWLSPERVQRGASVVLAMFSVVLVLSVLR